MSVLIASAIPKPLIYGGGIQLKAQQIADCTPLAKSPACVTIPILWANYGANSLTPVSIDVNLGTLGPNNPLDYVRSCYIDNTFSPTPVYAYFPDTQFVVVCPPYSTCLAPVWTNSLNVQLFATNFEDGNIPTTVYQFSNVHVNAYTVVPALPVDTAKSIYLEGHFPLTHAAGIVHTYNNMPLGEPAPSRVIFLMVNYQQPVATPTINALTIGGVAAAKLIEVLNAGKSTVLYKLAVPLGTVANIIITFSVSVLQSTIDIYSTYNLANSALPYDSQSGVAVGTLTCLGPPNGIIITGSNTVSGPATPPSSTVQNYIQKQEVINAAAFSSSHGYQKTTDRSFRVVKAVTSQATIIASFN